MFRPTVAGPHPPDAVRRSGGAMFILFAAFVLAAGIDATPQEAGVPGDARTTIAAANADWLSSLKAGDAERIAAPYADDGLFVTATGSTVAGREAIARLMRD